MAGRGSSGFLGGLARDLSLRHGGAPVLAACVALWVSGCGASLSNLGAAPHVAGYQAANLFSPTGYSLSNGPNGSLHVTAAGPPGHADGTFGEDRAGACRRVRRRATSQDVQATPAQTSIKCGKTKTSVKGELIDIKPIDYRVVAIDVTYGTDAMDPQVRANDAKRPRRLKAQIASETVPPDVQAAAAQEVAQQCGR